MEAREPVSTTSLLLFRGDTIDVFLLYEAAYPPSTSSPAAVGVAEADVVLWNGAGASGHVLARCRLLHPNIRMVEATASGPVTFSASPSFEPALKWRMICYEQSTMHGRAGRCTQLTPVVMNMPPRKEPIHMAAIGNRPPDLNSHNENTSAISRSRPSLAVNFQSFEPALEPQMICYEHTKVNMRAGPHTQLTPLVMNLPCSKELIDMYAIAAYSRSRSCLPDGTGSSRFHIAIDPSGIPHLLREQCTWAPVLGFPMKQTVPYTCALVAATVCLEAQHRLEFERLNGVGTFPCRVASPRMLRRSCERYGIWAHGVGVRVMGRLLDQIKKLGGVRTTNAKAPFPSLLPLSSWEEHTPDCRERVAEIIDSHGPCIGVTERTWWFRSVDVEEEELVHKGGNNEEEDLVQLSDGNQEEDLAHLSGGGDEELVQQSVSDNEELEPRRLVCEGRADRHAMVCYSYCYKGTGMDVLVLDNDTETDPRRWIKFQELHRIYTLKVEAMDSKMFRGRHIRYPLSGSYLLGYTTTSSVTD